MPELMNTLKHAYNPGLCKGLRGEMNLPGFMTFLLGFYSISPSPSDIQIFHVYLPVR